MAYYTVRQLADTQGNPTGRWHYTRQDGAGIVAVGYCSRFRTCPTCEGRSFLTTQPCVQCDRRGLIEVEPCPGHDTIEGAIAHFRDYQIDTATFDRVMRRQQRPCTICGAFTQRYAQLGDDLGYIFELCDAHHTPVYLRQAVEVRAERKNS